ncbi:hypothetical protein NHN26_01650 [Rhodovulum tesquicola]|uniref:hypothetical protein n=1 Tax=Rhodovulum tesquicola TaxID=540254 RepID=UPI002097F2AC|nr:hypothetical protein [Rhodovulum tesquicola]MCO8143918.1 hypothetical protein [Rhodovulum tesquicola]
MTGFALAAHRERPLSGIAGRDVDGAKPGLDVEKRCAVEAVEGVDPERGAFGLSAVMRTIAWDIVFGRFGERSANVPRGA